MSPDGRDAERTTASAAPTVRRATTDDVGALIDLDLASARHHAALDPGLYRVPDRAAVAAFLRPRLRNLSSCGHVRVFATCSFVSHARRAVATP